MADLTRVLCAGDVCSKLDADPHMMKEWLVTNGIGGYASGTVAGAITRRYHGLLIAALPNPLGRMMMLNGLSERLRLPDRRVVYTGAGEIAGITPETPLTLCEFRLEAGLPVWRYEVDGFVLEKRIIFPYRQNTVHVTYLLLAGTVNCDWGFGRRCISDRTMHSSANDARHTINCPYLKTSSRLRELRTCLCCGSSFTARRQHLPLTTRKPL